MRNSFLIFLFILLCLPLSAFAAANTPVLQPFEVAGWVPYWREATGTADAIAHIGTFTEISPFGFQVKKNGDITDPMHIFDQAWQNLIAAAHAQNVKVIPTMMWSDTTSIYKVLKSPSLRKAHVQQITNIISAFNFDGVDIDYEGKSSQTKTYFSAFLSQLAAALKKLPDSKLLVCTIEARTPPDAQFDKIPKYLGYANDLPLINKYCDRVRIMTYDQGNIDLRLNAVTVPPYNPISDSRWVEKVINLMSQSISKKKILIGVPTYGHEYEITQSGGVYNYNFLTSFNPKYALDIANLFNITPVRNEAGELSFAYTPTTTPNLPQRFFSWSDASAMADKVQLAKKLGVRGVAVFKIDGGEDAAMWSVLK